MTPNHIIASPGKTVVCWAAAGCENSSCHQPQMMCSPFDPNPKTYVASNEWNEAWMFSHPFLVTKQYWLRQNPATPHGGSVYQIKQSINISWAVTETKCDKIFTPFLCLSHITAGCISSLNYNLFITHITAWDAVLNIHRCLVKTIPILLASAAKVHRVDSSPRFPPANQVLWGRSLTGIETLGPRRLGVLGCGRSGCRSRLIL